MAHRDDQEAFEQAERALALLEGKDPEVVRKARLLREKDAHHDQRRQQAQALQRKLQKASATRRALLAAAVAAGGGLAVWALLTTSDRSEQASRLVAPHAAPLLSAGFRVARLGATRKGKAEVSAQLDGCVAAVGAEAGEAAPVELSIDGQRVRGQGVAVACGCTRLAVSASAEGKAGPAALGLYRAPGPAVGGARRLRRSLPGVALLDLGAACAEADLDAWLASSGKAAAQASASEAGGPVVEALTARGLRVAGFDPRGDDVVPFSLDAEDCGLVLASRPALRGPGGAIWAEGGEGGLAFCGASADVASVVPRAPGPVIVAAARMADLDGLLALIDAARAAGVQGSITTTLGPRAIAPSTQRLLERTARQATPVRSLPAAPEARLVAVATTPSVQPAPSGPLVCDPPLDAGVAQTLCLLPPNKELPLLTTDRTAFVAPMPLWLRALERPVDPVSHTRALALLGLARRLRAEGFEPVTLESVRESFAAAEITGRAGEDRVVAVGLSPRPPYAIPLTDGPRWSLDGPPRVIPLAPGARLTLRDPRLASAPLGERRTLVFRAPARKPP